jgi:hypothetical protein
MSGLGLLDGVDRESTYRVDRQLIESVGVHIVHFLISASIGGLATLWLASRDDR